MHLATTSLRPITYRLRRLGLVARFSIVGLSVGVLVAGGLAVLVEARLTELLLGQLAARAVDQVDHLGMIGYLTEADFEPPHTADKLEAIGARLDPLFAHLRDDGSGVIRLHLFAPDGTIVYSDLPSKRGQKIEADDYDHLAEALEGQVEQEVSRLSSSENYELQWDYGEALEVYVPFQLDGRVLGVYEIYQDLAPTRPVRPLVWGTVGGGFAVLFLALFGVVYAAAALIRRQQTALTHQAFHDALTNLPNRALFLDRVGRALAQANTTSVAVLFLDLDNFKFVNDSLGHDIGDSLLVGVAERLRAAVRPGDTVARLGGDEFAVLLERVTDLSAALRVADRIGEQLRAPFVLDGQEVFTAVSIGVALSGRGHDRPDRLLREADVAMYRAKANGKSRYEVFDRAMGNRAMERLKLESDLRRAIERRELVLHYQPILSLQEDRISEVEALVRWQHPERGLVPPAEFIPLAEETGLIVPIGQWVLEQACRQARAWQTQVPTDPPLVLSVNLSARQLEQPDLLMVVARVLRESGLAPSSLKLEITESLAMQDAEATVKTLRDLKRLGVQVAIDDFGTGYSSLAYLNRFPVDTLKIDRSFVARLDDDPENRAVVRTIIALAKTLGLVVTGEGIETAEQGRLLRRLGCDLGQGYYFARPQPAEIVGGVLAAPAGVPRLGPRADRSPLRRVTGTASD